MEEYIKKVLNKGDDSGNEMVVEFQLPSGLEIFSFPTKNFYGGHWDLGPTWNFAIMANKPFLVDSGRFGQGKNLVDMMGTANIKPADLDFVMISHGHEDHDGGLAEFLKYSDLKLKAHKIYDLLIRTYPDKSPLGEKGGFPAKCWHCPMPETFYKEFCLDYHKVLQGLKVETINDGIDQIGQDIQTYHLPGHSPDCLATMLGEEAIIVGDIVLPGITPWPTRESLFDEVAGVLRPLYDRPDSIFGLDRYIKSLKKLHDIALAHPDIIVLPAHRIFHNGQWNSIQLAERVEELIQHHIERCGAILEILSSSPKTAEEIAKEHFEEDLLKGYGSMMAENEIVSHCELLIKNRDMIELEDNRYTATGETNFEKNLRI